ncbi:unnamed protein product [Tenebrio molitor]|nr:unnamed protein product [Tenebrio molitor]
MENHVNYFFMFITSNSSSAFLITCSNLSNCIIIIVRIIRYIIQVRIIIVRILF